METKTKMTSTEFFKTVAKGEWTEDEVAAMVAYAEAMIEKNSQPSKARIENEKILKDKLLPVLTTNPLTTTDLAEMLELSTSKVTAVAKIGVEQGLVIKGELKGKKTYALAE